MPARLVRRRLASSRSSGAACRSRRVARSGLSGWVRNFISGVYRTSYQSCRLWCHIDDMPLSLRAAQRYKSEHGWAGQASDFVGRFFCSCMADIDLERRAFELFSVLCDEPADKRAQILTEKCVNEP